MTQLRRSARLAGQAAETSMPAARKAGKSAKNCQNSKRKYYKQPDHSPASHSIIVLCLVGFCMSLYPPLYADQRETVGALSRQASRSAMPTSRSRKQGVSFRRFWLTSVSSLSSADFRICQLHSAKLRINPSAQAAWASWASSALDSIIKPFVLCSYHVKESATECQI